MATFAALLAVVLIWGLVSGRLARYSITLPIVLVVMGAVLSATRVVVVELDSEAVRTLVELALAVMLFANATEVSARWLRGSGQLPLRMLALGFPLTVATGFASGYLLLPGMSIWVLALLAAALAATDAALASSWPARHGKRRSARGRGTVGPRAGRARRRWGGRRGDRRQRSPPARFREPDALEQRRRRAARRPGPVEPQSRPLNVRAVIPTG